MKKLILTLGLIAGLNCLYATPIHDAALVGDLEKIKSLVSNGVNINVPQEDGYTPLHFAVSNSRLEVVELLISLGADVDVLDPAGDTPLLRAIELEDISIATDGKLGGPAELQKSDDLKNWRRLGDVPEDANEVLVTPRDSGNEFFRLKRIDE